MTQRYLLALLGVFLISACDSMRESSEKVTQDVQDNVHETALKVADWSTTHPVKPEQPADTSYCYRVYQDILCYRQPMPGWEPKLIGYQGPNTTPPNPVVMKPLPVYAKGSEAKTEANRVAAAQPVFKEMPQEVKDDSAKGKDGVVANDSSHESLPDPKLSPQM